MQPILISRFLINLREAGTPNMTDMPRLSRFTVPNFQVPAIQTIVGNMGEPLEHGPRNNEVEDTDTTRGVSLDIIANGNEGLERSSAGVTATATGSFVLLHR